jgi:hypothetical protein
LIYFECGKERYCPAASTVTEFHWGKEGKPLKHQYDYCPDRDSNPGSPEHEAVIVSIEL